MAILRFLIFVKALFESFPSINQGDIFYILLKKTLVKTPKRIAFGFSLSALPLLDRLQASKYVDQIFISNSSSLSLEIKRSNNKCIRAGSTSVIKRQ